MSGGRDKRQESMSRYNMGRVGVDEEDRKERSGRENPVREGGEEEITSMK